MNALKQDNITYAISLNQIIKPVVDRVQRFPNRAVRPDLLVDLARNWRALGSPNRLGFYADKTHHITEIRLTYLHLDIINQDGWSEECAAIAFVNLLAEKYKVSLQVRYFITFSHHAIGRFFQRSRITDSSGLRLAMASCLAVLPSEFAEKESVTIPTGEGFWRGTKMTLRRGAVVEPADVVAIRTWIDADSDGL